ncbi:aminotransferase class V-fold PLP-dependent enzyme [Ruminococcus albus]|uniref:Aminotransferase, class V n=1 Tax=Ruminococcus albus 8 TaxID=246199 RepID=E9SE75_RUMAL|nr:aminotransferase class V-fold PLP-dependent enzyme [Ruminococcus albus]EGC02445.1 aminotransferase, class V [Ruminococcus albus 8]MCC3350013.1 aminotransferase class V-fold PLP-dependent enzyme [Ruminococcus albus 8]
MEKKNTVNFDNSAGTHPKPESVRQAVAYAMRELGGNPGRGGHQLSMAAAERIYAVRKSAAEFFGAEIENAAFTPNCTYALNMAIKGLMQFGGHIIISGWEHNSASRPVYALTRNNGVKCSVCEIYPDDVQRTIEGIRRLIRRDTLCVCCMAASNVTGRIMPYHEIGELCRQRGIAFVCDCAQAAGVLPVSIKDGISFICTSGQKGLYGPTGTGLLISSGEFALSTIIEGGTGATSGELTQTPHMPEKLESGTLNTAGLIGLGAGIDFVKKHGIGNIRRHEQSLCKMFEDGLKKLGAEVYDIGCDRVPIVAFNLKGRTSEETASALNKGGFALRGGMHCAALAHESLGTGRRGAVRFSPSAFNSAGQVSKLLRYIGNSLTDFMPDQ